MGQLHLVVVVSDGRKMLATVPSGSTIGELRQQLAREIGDTFGTQLPNGLQYLGKVVATLPAPAAAGHEDGAGQQQGQQREMLPEHFALSSAAVAAGLLQDGDTVLAVEGSAASVVEPAMNVLTDAGQPPLRSVADCALRLREIERLAAAATAHVSGRMVGLAAAEPRAAVGPEGLSVLAKLAGAGSAAGGSAA
eukprot:SAG22_NODE_5627_length_981_cov_1.520408_1_plen_193_part_10